MASFEDFVADLIRPMHYKLIQQVRVTGMEIDQQGVLVIADALRASAKASNADLGDHLDTELKMNWKPASSLRYANGLRRYYEWASISSEQRNHN